MRTIGAGEKLVYRFEAKHAGAFMYHCGTAPAIFDTMYKEGAYALRPGTEEGGAQALDLQPAQGGFVEFTFDEPGQYPIVTHKFRNASRGALGLFEVGQTAGAEEPAH